MILDSWLFIPKFYVHDERILSHNTVLKFYLNFLKFECFSLQLCGAMYGIFMNYNFRIMVDTWPSFLSVITESKISVVLLFPQVVLIFGIDFLTDDHIERWKLWQLNCCCITA